MESNLENGEQKKIQNQSQQQQQPIIEWLLRSSNRSIISISFPISITNLYFFHFSFSFFFFESLILHRISSNRLASNRWKWKHRWNDLMKLKLSQYIKSMKFEFCAKKKKRNKRKKKKKCNWDSIETLSLSLSF